MIGKTKKTASGIYLPDMSHPTVQYIGRTGKLPPIAGGATSWKLTVPLTTAKTVKKGKVISLSTKRNLLKDDSPSIMSEWMITDIRIPVLTYLEIVEGAGKKQAFIFSFGIRLILGGDIVWSANERVSEKPSAVEIWYPTTFSANLTQPIVVPRGRGLEVELSATLQVAEEITAEVAIGMGAVQSIEAGVVPPAFQISEGDISYYVQKLSGHRTL